MPKRPNNRPWPENLAYDFELPTLSPAAAEGFIDSLATSDRNKEFLRLRYREGKTYTEIAAAHGMTPAGVRLAIIAMQEKFGGGPLRQPRRLLCQPPRPQPRPHRPQR